MERTLIVVKPHAVERRLVGAILERFERMGFRIVAIRAVDETAAFWDRFYPSDTAWLDNLAHKALHSLDGSDADGRTAFGTADASKIGHQIKNWLVDHMASGISVAAVLEGHAALRKVRIACGSTLPNEAAPGTIRFDYSTDSPALATAGKRPVFNIVHSSDPDETRGKTSAAEYEIGLVFPELA